MHKILPNLIVLILVNCWVNAQTPQVEVLVDTFIFKKAPFKQCHASTLVETTKGDILAAWFGGEYERHPQVAIYTSRLTPFGWSAPEQVADGQTAINSISYPTWNPVLFNNAEDELMLFYKEGPSPSTWWGMLKISDDDGKSWSDAKRLPDGIIGPVKNKPIRLKSGVIVSPSSIESQGGEVWKSHMELSNDEGHTWEKVDIPSGDGIKVIQPTILQLGDGTLKALLRSDQNYLMESTSSDSGKTWSETVKSKVLNPNSGVDAVTLNNGSFLLVYNPTEAGADWADGRNKLNLAYSEDGENWEDILKLEGEPEGEFSYPAIIQDSQGLVHISYTHNRNTIKYLKLRLSK
ncbi:MULTISPECIES: exo-alpha-sialidase [unclassified Leeuwenhoekiella]|uniref:sialidase family protein n=1 Tax=unclassified Leeuwenhoekiella TaxID=2615029 RepID=UPI000C5D93C8|nr:MULTISPECIES: sialidase family protein [unclassified Leeuwenhoekiella]MAW94377.1 sialidase [Leeuwenhoekiella sp.]MBA81054.1 sialidase [Leeuwenhoekiella sp.]|tara:strand:+ start:12152 stop:13198 length:1047 start_codon:yes stop_codon:yes gene_type:complete